MLTKLVYFTQDVKTVLVPINKIKAATTEMIYEKQ